MSLWFQTFQLIKPEGVRQQQRSLCHSGQEAERESGREQRGEWRETKRQTPGQDIATKDMPQGLTSSVGLTVVHGGTEPSTGALVG